ncbi:ABC transporter ATP-binding protein [Mesorhizobium sp. CO1-1-8]|uniref:ABC transporter ATP-binding protein n=1 Tax=Mesorhizobium sp. CO1-1-8 TaxID=2876631 RepID=UPI001CD08C00|nr:ABC transporter ATP-binding protein [Mesorhizobium sp. CO1-1-8]MBZ9772568.1 ABC transporter ATP-binding protein [Mesorhizobium sp. CO1-1-8]
MSEHEAILKVDKLCSGYGRSQVLFGIDLACPNKGSIALLGRNGSGKSTFLKTLVGELKSTKGSISFDGAEVQGEATEKRVRRGIGYVPQENAVFASLSVRENLALGAAVKRSDSDIDMVLDFFPKLGARLKFQAGTLSGGERKMLAIGRALLGKPKLLLLDEPTEGVWIGVIEEIADRLTLLAKDMALIIVEQHVELALRVCGHAYVMDRGTIALSGTASEVRDNPKLVRFLAP